MRSLGERLKQARLAAGFSQRELATRAGPLSAMAISKYENDQSVPGSDVLLRLAEALGVKVGYFHRPTDVTIRLPAYRRHNRLGRKAQAAIEARVTEVLERYVAVEEMFEPGRLPTFGTPRACRRSVSSLDDVEHVAEHLRDEWELGEDPIANLCETLEDNGVKVILLPDVDEGFDGYSCWANNTTPVVVGRSADDIPGDRQRFSLAHELGHLLLERGDDRESQGICHRFAAALLVPQEAVREEIGERRGTIHFQELHSLKHKWGLSLAAWLRRLSDLGIISQRQYQIVQRQFRRKGWHRREPGEPLEPERTERMQRLVQRAVAEDLISVGRAADFLNRPLVDVWQEMGWPHEGVAAV